MERGKGFMTKTGILMNYEERKIKIAYTSIL